MIFVSLLRWGESIYISNTRIFSGILILVRAQEFYVLSIYAFQFLSAVGALLFSCLLAQIDLLIISGVAMPVGGGAVAYM